MTSIPGSYLPLPRTGIVYRNALSGLLARLAGHGLMLAALVMWGGLFRLNAADAPEIAGLFRFQDVLAGLSGVVLVVLFLAKSKWSPRTLAQGAMIMALAAYAALIGWINGNALVNIAAELRAFLYIITGIGTAMILRRSTLDGMLRLYATLMSIAILAQFALLAVGINSLFLTDAHQGSAFTVNLPIARPQAFHLVGVVFILAITRPGRSRFELDTWIMLAALIVVQSKTYWLMAALVTVVSILSDRAFSQISKLTLMGLGAMGLIVMAFLPISAGDRARSALELVYEKFALVFQDETVGYGVIGIRVDEARLLLAPLDEPAELIFGRGLGYVYRDTDLFFYREDPRDKIRLAMFGHNYYLWLLLKTGLVGALLFAGAITPVFLLAVARHRDRRRFVTACLTLLIGAITLGSMENPVGGYLLGVLMACAVLPERQGNKLLSADHESPSLRGCEAPEAIVAIQS